MEASQVLKELSLQEENVLNIYSYGSRVYGTANEHSDYDFIIVVKGLEGKKEEVGSELINATLYDEKSFQEMIDEHEISVLECLSLPKELVLMEKKPFSYSIQLGKLRLSLSQKASNSFVKAKKKLIVEKDFNPYVAKKSLFHSMRIPMFGVQLATKGKIEDFSVANDYWSAINKVESNDWEVFKEKFQSIYNGLCSEFRKVAPKDL